MPSPLNVEKFYPNVENFDQYIENFDENIESSNENDKNLYKIIDEAELDLYDEYNVDPIIEVLPWKYWLDIQFQKALKVHKLSKKNRNKV